MKYSFQYINIKFKIQFWKALKKKQLTKQIAPAEESRYKYFFFSLLFSFLAVPSSPCLILCSTGCLCIIPGIGKNAYSRAFTQFHWLSQLKTRCTIVNCKRARVSWIVNMGQKLGGKFKRKACIHTYTGFIHTYFFYCCCFCCCCCCFLLLLFGNRNTTEQPTQPLTDIAINLSFCMSNTNK